MRDCSCSLTVPNSDLNTLEHMKNSISSPTFFYRFNLIILTLILCSYGFYAKVGGLTLRPEKVLILLLYCGACVAFILRKGRIRYTRAELFLAGWILISAVSSALSDSPLDTLKSTLDLGLSVSFFFVASMWSLERMILITSRPILTIGVILGAGSVAVAALYLSGTIDYVPIVTDFIMVERNMSRIKMSMPEANLFGAIMMVFALISLAEFRRSSAWSWICLVFCHAGMLMAFSRGPFLGYLFGLLFYCHILGFYRAKWVLSVVLVMGLFVATLVLVGTAQNGSQNALTRTSTMLPRILTFEYAMEDIKKAPIIGSGTYSIDILHPNALKFVGTYNEKMWISLLPAAILHDSGWIGFLLFQVFLILIFRDGYCGIQNVVKKQCPRAIARRMAAWLGAGIGMLIVSLSTSAYSLAFFWITMALVASIPKACRQMLTPKMETVNTL